MIELWNTHCITASQSNLHEAQACGYFLKWQPFVDFQDLMLTLYRCVRTEFNVMIAKCCHKIGQWGWRGDSVDSAFAM